MIIVKGALNGLLALVSLVITAISFWRYVAGGGGGLWLAGVIIFLILTLIFGGLFLSGKMNKTEEIHITE